MRAARRSAIRKALLGSLTSCLLPLVPVQAQTHTASTAQSAATTERPNIIVLLADDMGYSDISLYGSEIPTPNIDALAKTGVKFKQFYNAARCSPTRASLLTGTYPHQAGLGNLQGENGDGTVRQFVPGEGSPGTRGTLQAKRTTTIAEVLHDAGYYTAMAGKWHVGGNPKNFGFDAGIVLPSNLYWPDQKPTTPGTSCPDKVQKPVISRFDNTTSPKLDDCFRADDPEALLPSTPKEWYASDLLVDWAKQYISQSGGAKPFFLYLPFTAPHFPIMAPKDKIKAIRELCLYPTADVKTSASCTSEQKAQANKGWPGLRDARFANQKAAKLFPQDAALSKQVPQTLVWSTMSDADKERSAEMMTVYAADVSSLDDSIGRLTCWLKHTSAADLQTQGITADASCKSPTDAADADSLFNNTLIIFLSDNGSSAEGGPIGVKQGTLGDPDSTVKVGLNIAQVNNTPFAYAKHYAEEGGIATPLIASWPAGITSHGDITQAGHIIDLMPTLIDAANSGTGTAAAYPTTAGIVAEQGISFLPAFTGQTIGHTSRVLFWNHESNVAARTTIDGVNWKIVSQSVDWKPKATGDTFPAIDKWRLYNLTVDPAETRDLACTLTSGSAAATAFDTLTNAYKDWRLNGGTHTAYDDQFLDDWIADSTGDVHKPASGTSPTGADAYQKYCTN